MTRILSAVIVLFLGSTLMSAQSETAAASFANRLVQALSRRDRPPVAEIVR